MSRRHTFRSLRVWGLPCVLLLVNSVVQASGPGIGHLFCPVNKRCQEKPPHWHIKRTCPKAVCDPCLLEHHGYYHTCWRPSSVPADWSHCPVPPPAVVFGAGQELPPVAPHPALLFPATPLPHSSPVIRPEPGSRPLPEPLPAKPAPAKPDKSVKPTKPAVPLVPPPQDKPTLSTPSTGVSLPALTLPPTIRSEPLVPPRS